MEYSEIFFLLLPSFLGFQALKASVPASLVLESLTFFGSLLRSVCVANLAIPERFLRPLIWLNHKSLCSNGTVP